MVIGLIVGLIWYRDHGGASHPAFRHRELKFGDLPGGTVFEKDIRMFGEVKGGATVKSGVSLKLTGEIKGDLTLEPGSSVTMLGRIKGDVIDYGGELNHIGEIRGTRRTA